MFQAGNIAIGDYDYSVEVKTTGVLYHSRIERCRNKQKHQTCGSAFTKVSVPEKEHLILSWAKLSLTTR